VYLSQCVVQASTTAIFENTDSMAIYYDSKDESALESAVEVLGFKDSLSPNANISLQIWLTHTSTSDCYIRLYGPDSRSITLSRAKGSANTFNGTLFTDSALNSVLNYTFPQDGVVTPLQPKDPFSKFRGINPNGKWRLWVNDEGFEDDGELNGFILNIQGFFFFFLSLSFK